MDDLLRLKVEACRATKVEFPCLVDTTHEGQVKANPGDYVVIDGLDRVFVIHKEAVKPDFERVSKSTPHIIGDSVETLKDTVPFMLAKSHKDRLKGEYYQLVIRYEKLRKLIRFQKVHGVRGLDWDLLNTQLECMECYMAILKTRAFLEKIEL